MASYALTDAADEDLDELLIFIEHTRGPRTAEHVERRLHAAMNSIALMPGIGHARRDVDDAELRFLRVQSFLVAYRPRTDPVQIVRVLHGSRDVGAVLKPRETKT